MDHKRAFLAITVSLAFLVLWSWYFAPQHQPVPRTDTPHVESQPSPAPEITPIDPSLAPPPAIAPGFQAETPLDPGFTAAPLVRGKQITVRNPYFQAVFNSEGGVLERFELLQYRQTIDQNAPFVDLIGSPEPRKRPMGLLWNSQPTWMQGEWTFEGENLHLQHGQTGTLTFIGRFGLLELVRTFQFTGDSYLIDEQVQVRNHSPNQISATLGFTLASEALSAIRDRYTPTQIMFYDATGLEQEKSEKRLLPGIQAEGGIRWGAIQSNYFLTAVVPAFNDPVFKARLEDGVHRAVMETRNFVLDPQLEMQFRATYYLGPREREALSVAPGNLLEALHYGWFDLIASPLIQVLNFFYGYVHNYGLAIILLTVVIKLIFWPLSQKSYKSMQQMKKLQPMMLKLREKHKDDRQKMNEEMMQLYKTYKVNPLGGCLPIAVQIPVFISLYQALMGAIELRHAPFISHVPFTDIIWLADLSARDPYYITPVVMGATMFLQQKLTPAPGDPMQAKIMLFLPIIFTFLFLSFPSGLVLYWLVNNVLSIAQQWWVMRKA
ncbi:YidC/Oxa1 family membrane protein insertase [Desulfonatronum thiosulfatophilum]|uniref:Membrane protein insertase YidC n=1 Tax=Desulfonatronum thiosulfatophilum TaxID=617002 RepID=A0A1G6CXF1_9BACT|nr:membrane protein insertase YidC [Desulfonatronum thiosulfatophilum]SDB37355.1 YidC/Oxa1 family membrane protein insertase [Desulfonatronum thiosulfatophilum]